MRCTRSPACVRFFLLAGLSSGLGDRCRYVANSKSYVMANWKSAGIVVEGQPITVGGLNPWDHEWKSSGAPAIELPHPSYPNQLHRMSVYEISNGNHSVAFAAGELSANVWGFYVPDEQSDGN